eukprot:2973758-Ditylum_brightwellii.AAC.1
MVHFSPPPAEPIIFPPAFPDSIHKEVRYADGIPLHIPCNMYVMDDNLITEVPSRIKQAMAASIKSLFILMGFPEPHMRRNAACMEKFLAAM